MSLLRRWSVAAVLLLCCPWNTSQAGVYLGVGFGGPGYYYRPYGWNRGWGYGFYRPYGFGVVAAPPLVVVGAPPVFVQQPAVVQQPVVVQPTYTQPPPPSQAPAPLPMPTPSTSNAAPDVLPTAAVGGGSDIDAALQQLRSGDEQIRADAAVRLGRLRAEQAIGPIVKALNSDSSPKVREAAARGLGLIGSPTSLSALQYAAQADDDREVRHSASFAAETIRSSLHR